MELDKAVSLISALRSDLLANGGTEADLENISTNDGLRAKIVSLILGSKKAIKQAVDATITKFQVLVNYDAKLKTLAKRGGLKYVDSDINDHNFKTTGSGETSLEANIIHFNRVMDSDAVIVELDKLGLRPSDIHELLCFNIENPGEMDRYPIVALRSRWRYGVVWFTPWLYRWDAARGLRLSWWDDEWGGSCRFLAFRK